MNQARSGFTRRLYKRTPDGFLGSSDRDATVKSLTSAIAKMAVTIDDKNEKIRELTQVIAQQTVDNVFVKQPDGCHSPSEKENLEQDYIVAIESYNALFEKYNTERTAVNELGKSLKRERSQKNDYIAMLEKTEADLHTSRGLVERYRQVTMEFAKRLSELN